MFHGSPGSLLDVLALPVPACVSLIGGGGKTTAMLSLAREAHDRGLRAAVTTTTKIWPPADVSTVIWSGTSSLPSSCTVHAETGQLFAVGSGLSDRGKLLGLPSQAVQRLREGSGLDLVVCEADGSAGRPLKAHAAHEPVIPDCSDVVLIVAGVDAVGQVATDEVIHRLTEYESRLRGQRGSVLSATDVARVVRAAAERVPAGIPRIYVLNRCDRVPVRVCVEVEQAILRDEPSARVLRTVRGQVVSDALPRSGH